jgi:hypothetical protein
LSTNLRLGLSIFLLERWGGVKFTGVLHTILIRIFSFMLLKLNTWLSIQTSIQLIRVSLCCALYCTRNLQRWRRRGGCNVNIEMVSTPVNNCTVVLLVNLATPLCIRCVDSCLSFIIPLQLCCNKGRKQVGGGCRKCFESLFLWQSRGQLPTQNSIHGQTTSCDTLVINSYSQTDCEHMSVVNAFFQFF